MSLQRLTSAQYECVRPLFAPLDYSLAIRSVIAGRTNGQVFVDDTRAPTCAVVWNGAHECFIAGAPGGAELFLSAGCVLHDEIVPAARVNPDLKDVLIHIHPPAVRERPGAVLPDTPTVLEDRCYFELTTAAPDVASSRLPDGYKLVEIDRELLESTSLVNHDEIQKWIAGCWIDPAQFLSDGIGVCAIRENTIASWCLADYALDGRCEIGVETDDAHQKRGLGTAVVARAVGRCVARGLRVGWHCWASNEASIALARKIGFTRVRDYSVRFCWVNPFDNLIVNGNIRYMRGDHAGAAPFYEEAFERWRSADPSPVSDFAPDGEFPALYYFVAACCHSIAGETERAASLLVEAVDRGYSNFEQLRTKDELAAVRGSPHWSSVEQRLTS